jgi:hypothetical protein
MGILWAGTNGCGDDCTTAPLGNRLQALRTDLTVGSTGDDVRTLHDYLTAYGYYPNEELGRAFPRWKPVVAAQPADAPTREMMKKLRCGVPDNMLKFDPSDKFGLVSVTAASTNWTFSVVSPPSPLTVSDVVGASLAAGGAWTVRSALTFQQSNTSCSTAAPHVTITSANPSPSLASALAWTDGSGGYCPKISLNKTIDWVHTDVQAVLTHELGHAFGLDHSAWRGAEMEPASSTRLLDPDDMVAISTLWDTYRQVSGSAKDIGVSPDGSSVWVIGTNAVGSNFGIFKFNPGGWWDQSDGFAVRIAVDWNGQPWVVNAAGEMFVRNSNTPFSGFWQQIPGTFHDVATSANFTVWAVGSTPTSGGFRVMKHNGLTFDQDPLTTGAVRIAVSPSGNPWIVNSSGAIFRRTTSDLFSGSWESIPGNAVDIAAGPGHVQTKNGFSTDGTEWHVNGSVLYVWDEQPGFVDSNPGSSIPQTKQWRVGGDDRGTGSASPRSLLATAVSVGGNVQWVVGSNGAIFTSFQ